MTRHERRAQHRRWKKKCLEAPQRERAAVSVEVPAGPPRSSAPATAESIIKVCGCGRRYTAADWRQLTFCGVIQPEDGAFAELRNCACGSSIAVRVRILNVLALVPVAT